MFNNYWLSPVIAVVTFILITSAPVQAQDFQRPVDSSFVEHEIRFTGELGVVYTYRWNLSAQGNRLAMCGIGYLRDSRLRNTVRDMARDGELVVDGQTYRVNFSFFSRASSRNALASGTANCIVTQAPLPRSGSAQMRFGSGVFRN